MLTAGEVLRDSYRIVQRLGGGGMGDVYLAEQIGLQRQVAIKECRLVSESETHLFESEARILCRLRHARLPQVHDFFAISDHHYLVMEFIRGRSLQTHLAAHHRFSEAQVLTWAAGICDALDYLHTHRPPVIFRDLKPSNLMLDDCDEIRLIDFGISKEVDLTTGEGKTPSAAQGTGTPGFCAPEQLAGKTDARSDIYSLGATLYYLLSGKVPPSSIELMMGTAQITPLASLCPAVSTVTLEAIERMMRLNPTDRPATVAEARQALPAGAVPEPAPGPTGPLDQPPNTTTAVTVPTDTVPAVTVPTDTRRMRRKVGPWVMVGAMVVLGVVGFKMWPAPPLPQTVSTPIPVASGSPGQLVFSNFLLFSGWNYRTPANNTITTRELAVTLQVFAHNEATAAAHRHQVAIDVSDPDGKPYQHFDGSLTVNPTERDVILLDGVTLPVAGSPMVKHLGRYAVHVQLDGQTFYDTYFEVVRDVMASQISIIVATPADENLNPVTIFHKSDAGVRCKVVLLNEQPKTEHLHSLLVQAVSPDGKPFGPTMGGKLFVHQGQVLQPKVFPRDNDDQGRDGFKMADALKLKNPYGHWRFDITVDGKRVQQLPFTIER